MFVMLGDFTHLFIIFFWEDDLFCDPNSRITQVDHPGNSLWSYVTLPRTGFWGGTLYFPLFFLNLGDERVTIPKCNLFNASLANFLSSLLVCEIDKSLPCPNGEKRHAGGM